MKEEERTAGNTDSRTQQTMFWERTPQGVRCFICPHECHLKEGQVGICRNRANREQKLVSLSYGKACAIQVDPVEKKPLYHFHPGTKTYSIGTAGCNLRCKNCQNWDLSQHGPDEMAYHELAPEEVVEQCLQSGSKLLSFTYNEPITSFEYVYDSCRLACKAGLKTILVSAGYINEQPLRTLSKYISAANIDLKVFSDDIYKKLNGARLQPVLRTLQVLKEQGVWLEITNLVIPGWTDDEETILEMCQWLMKNGFEKNPIHFIRFFPTPHFQNSGPTPPDTLERIRQIAMNEGLQYVYTGNLPTSSGNHTYCPSCQKLLVERLGYHTNIGKIKNGACEYCGEPIAGVW